MYFTSFLRWQCLLTTNLDTNIFQQCLTPFGAHFSSVQTKVRFCPPARAGPPASQNAEHLARSGPLVGVQKCRISDRSSGKYRSFGKMAEDLSKMQNYLAKMGRDFAEIA